MSAEVVSLRNADIQTDRKTEFLHWAAGAYDAYVEKAGEEPDALVMVHCGLRQAAHVTWMIQGESRGAGTPLLALAHVALLREATTTD